MTDQGGGIEKQWHDVAVVWASIEATGGDEIIHAMHLQARTGYRIIIRHRSDVQPAMRILAAGKIFNIRNVFDRSGDRRFLEIIADEGVLT